jgi:hypothetical protein
VNQSAFCVLHGHGRNAEAVQRVQSDECLSDEDWNGFYGRVDAKNDDTLLFFDLQFEMH